MNFISAMGFRKVGAAAKAREVSQNRLLSYLHFDFGKEG
jgi:hypothetical protein